MEIIIFLCLATLARGCALATIVAICIYVCMNIYLYIMCIKLIGFN